MKLTNRYLSLLLAVIMMISVFAGCADVPASSADPSSSESASSEPASSEPASSEPASSEPASSEPTSSEPVEPSSSVVEPDVKDPTKAPTQAAKDPTKAPTKAPTQAPTVAPTKAADKYAAEPDVDLGGFVLRVRSEGFSILVGDGGDKHTVELRKSVDELTKKMNFSIVATANSGNYQDYNTVKKAIQAGSKTIGHFIYTNVPLGMAGYASGYYRDLREIDAETTGFDLDDPDRFWQAITNIATLDGKQFGLALCSPSLEVTEVENGTYFMFNKNLTAKAGYDAASIYKLVRDYKWTLDEATKIMEACYIPDANGDGKPEVYGLVSYQRQNKRYLQLDGGRTAAKVNGKYVFTAANDSVLGVMNWIKDVYVTKKIAATVGSSDVRGYVIDGKTAFSQAAGDYLMRSDLLKRVDEFNANCGIVPAPVGNNQIKKKQYVNVVGGDIYVMPITVRGEEMNKAATAFAAIAKRLTDVDAQLETVKELGILQNKDDEDMYQNYILTSFISDPGLVTEIIGNSNIDPMALMVNAIAGGSKEPTAAIQQYEGYITSTLNSIYRQ